MKRSKPKDYIENFTYNVTYLRKKHKISKKTMSQILGISIYNINKIEKGILPPRLNCDLIFEIQNKFNINATDVLERKLKK